MIIYEGDLYATEYSTLEPIFCPSFQIHISRIVHKVDFNFIEFECDFLF